MSEVSLEVDAGIATLGWDRRTARNAMDSATAAALTDHLHALAIREDIGAIVLLPAPGAFCAGWDLDELRGLTDLADAEIAAFLGGNVSLVDAVADAPQVTVAVIDGPCLGFGAALAARCDLRLASERSTVGFPEAPLGLVPAIAALDAVAVMSPGQATSWLATGRVRGAEHARQAGLLDEVVPTERLEATVAEVRVCFHAVRPEVLRATKLLVHRLLEQDSATGRQVAIEMAITSLRQAMADRDEG